MEQIEKFVSFVQTNKPINAIKTAIIKLAYINIGIAFFIFIYSFFKIEFKPLYLNLYKIYCLAIALGMSYIISEELRNESQEHYSMINLLVNAIIGIVLIQRNYISVYPLISAFNSVLVHYLMQISDQLSFKHKQIPPAVSDYFNRIIPVIIVVGLYLLLIIKFPEIITSFADGFIGLTGIVSSLIFILLVITIICSFWILGIHGVGVIGTLIRPFWLYMMIMNGYLVLQGMPAMYIGSEAFLQWAVWIGGSGCTIGLSILLFKFSKSKELRELGKESIIPNIFNINENIVFGVPIVDNKHFKIPFFAAPIICAIIAYSAFSLGWVNAPAIVSPWVLPAPIGIFISTLGDFRSIILSLVLIAVSTVVYLPFFLKYDKELEKESYNEN